DSCDSGRLRIAWDADNNETQSNHSEGSESSGANSSINGAQALMQLKSSLEPRPLKRWSAVVTLKNTKIPVVYHKSMARQFPSKERTPEQMEMRRRNTEAARLSRAKMKMAEMMMEKEASELSTANAAIKHKIASQLVYANELRKMLEMSSVELSFFRRVGHRNNVDA
uniref:BZIP domain-containing protein n=1 Tax=Anopheles stephensi TaxID=30069 RepID=A0A182YTJ3_ANOST